MSYPGGVGVALVHDVLTRGGAEKVLVTLANSLDRSRFRPHVIVTRDLGPLGPELSADIPVHEIGRGPLWDVRALRRFAAVMRERRLTICHTHSHTSGYFARLARILGGGDWVHILHDHYPLIGEDTLLRWADRVLLRGADYCFAVSEPLRRYALEWLRIEEDRCERLLNGIPIPAASEGPRAPVFTILQVARVTPQKDHRSALAIAERLRDDPDFPEFRWLAVGRTSSSHARECVAEAERRGLQDRFRFLGERPDVADLLGSAHVGVLTSRDEGLPIALLEYMAAGLPVVVTDVGDCGEIVRGSEGGTPVPHGDEVRFAEALARLASRPALARRAGERNRRYAASRFSAEAMVQRVSEVYEHLVSAAAPAGDGAVAPTPSRPASALEAAPAEPPAV